MMPWEKILALLPLLMFYVSTQQIFQAHDDLEPEFTESIPNNTVALGETVILTCAVDNLGAYRIAWIKVEGKTMLTMGRYKMVKNPRLRIFNQDYRHWNLEIRDVQESDRGEYLCQMNTSPMKTVKGYLDVVVPPTFLDSESSSEMLVREGSNATLSCRVRGHPQPRVTWRREDGQKLLHNICLPDNRCREDSTYDGAELHVYKLSRLNMGQYVCTAENGVYPPAVRKVMLHVHFPPMISVPHQLIGANLGDDATLQCDTEASPVSINYWYKDSLQMINDKTDKSGKYLTTISEGNYKVNMKLTIVGVKREDYGTYRCSARNSLGTTDSSIRLYQIEGDKHYIHELTTQKTDTVTGKNPPMNDGSKKNEGEEVVPPPVQRPSVADNSASTNPMNMGIKFLNVSVFLIIWMMLS